MIKVLSAVTATHAEGVELVSIAVAVSGRDVSTSALVDLSWAIAYATSVEFADAVVYVVADAICIGVFSAVTATHAEGVELVAVAIAVAGRNAVTAANAALVKLVAAAVAVSFWDV